MEKWSAIYDHLSEKQRLALGIASFVIALLLWLIIAALVCYALFGGWLNLG